MTEPLRAQRLTDQEGSGCSRSCAAASMDPSGCAGAMITIASAPETPVPAIARLPTQDQVHWQGLR